jgi:hypothetical protein
LDDPLRVALFARRFAPAVALAFDDGARLVLRDGRTLAVDGVARLAASGALSDEAAA